METAIELSCNTAFASLSHELGEDKVRDMASKYGIGDQDFDIPIPVETSCIGPRADGPCMGVVDGPALYQTGMGRSPRARPSTSPAPASVTSRCPRCRTR